VRFVLDASLAWACCFDDERTPFTDAVSAALPLVGAAVSPIWFYEVANILHVCKAKDRITDDQANRFVERLLPLPIVPVEQSAEEVLREIRELADVLALSAYDASYLHLASSMGLPLGTLDGSGKRPGLKQAAQRLGVEILTLETVQEWLKEPLNP